MNMKNIVRVISLILLVFMVFSFSYETCAAEYEISKWGSVNQFDDKTAKPELRKVFETPIAFVLSIVRTVAVIVAICSLLWGAIRYMAPNFELWGKVLDRAEVRRDIPKYIIGSMLLFGTSAILTFIQYVIEDVVP